MLLHMYSIVITASLLCWLVPALSESSLTNHSTASPMCQLQLECIGSNSKGLGRVRIPVRSAQGPPGRVGLPGPPSQPTKSSTIWIPRPTEYQIAFHAGLSKNIVEIPPHNCILTFDKVHLNMGNAYNATTGKFTAPVSGVYIFTVVISSQGHEKAGTRLLHNGRVTLLSWSESTFWSTVTNQAIIQMKKNDQVWLECREEAYQLHGYMYSNLSGYLLYATAA